MRHIAITKHAAAAALICFATLCDESPAHALTWHSYSATGCLTRVAAICAKTTGGLNMEVYGLGCTATSGNYDVYIMVLEARGRGC